jgi:hypothetical protein
MNGILVALTPQPDWTGKVGCSCGNLIPHPPKPENGDMIGCLVCNAVYRYTEETQWVEVEDDKD